MRRTLRLLFCFGLRWHHAATQFASRELCAVAMRRCHCLCRRGWLAFPRTIGLQIWTFWPFVRIVAPSLSLKCYVTIKFKMAEQTRSKRRQFGRFLRMKHQEADKTTLLWDVVTFRGFNRGRSNSAHTFYEDNRNFSPQCVIEPSFTQIPGVTKACLPIFGSSFTYIVFPVTHCGERCVIWTNFTW